MIVAVTREVSDAIGRCELTHLDRVVIDVPQARAQHAAYETALRGLGVIVERAVPAHDLPDAVFVEDMAVVMPEVAVMTRPGAESRRGEMAGVADALKKHRQLEWMRDGTLDGGDVLRIGRQFFVGVTSRTNRDGIAEFFRIVSRFGYEVMPVEVTGCLHLKSAVTAVGDNTILLNPKWVSPDVFAKMKRIEVDPGENWAANGLLVGDQVIFPEHFPRTRERLEKHRIKIVSVPCDELAKAEGAVTCCSILVET